MILKFFKWLLVTKPADTYLSRDYFPAYSEMELNSKFGVISGVSDKPWVKPKVREEAIFTPSPPGHPVKLLVNNEEKTEYGIGTINAHG